VIGAPDQSALCPSESFFKSPRTSHQILASFIFSRHRIEYTDPQPTFPSLARLTLSAYTLVHVRKDLDHQVHDDLAIVSVAFETFFARATERIQMTILVLLVLASHLLS